MTSLQPFEPFKPAYPDRLIGLGRPYLVSQTYARAVQTEQEGRGPVSILLSDYAEAGEAKLHLNAVKHDRYAAIVDLRRPAHLQRIREILGAGSGYRVYFAVVRNARELENHINKHYKDRLKKYVEQETNWRISHNAVVKPSIQLSFGEIFIILRHGSQNIRIKFEEIEKAQLTTNH